MPFENITINDADLIISSVIRVDNTSNFKLVGKDVYYQPITNGDMQYIGYVSSIVSSKNVLAYLNYFLHSILEKF